MIKQFFLVAAFLLLLCTHQSRAADFRNGFGAGVQYGGIVGWQGSFNSDNNKLRFSVGYAGITVGYDRYLGSKFSLGGQTFLNQYIVGAGMNLNYYFSSYSNSGWIIGLDVYRGYVTAEAGAALIVNYFEFVFNTDDTGLDAELDNRVILSIGYQF